VDAVRLAEGDRLFDPSKQLLVGAQRRGGIAFSTHGWEGVFYRRVLLKAHRPKRTHQAMAQTPQKTGAKSPVCNSEMKEVARLR
jgi:hypothetical protein